MSFEIRACLEFRVSNLGFYMILLQTLYARFLIPYPLDAFDSSSSGRDRCNYRQLRFERGAADGKLIIARNFPERGVDDEMNRIIFDLIDDVGTTFIDLECPRILDAMLTQECRSPRGGIDRKPDCPEALCDLDCLVIFVVVVDADEDASRCRQVATCA